VRAEVQPDGSFYVNLRSRNDGLLIGKRGMTIISIQALVNQIIKHRYPTMPVDIFVDVGGYRKRRENFLKKKAQAVARIVLDNKREMALDMLSEREFRMVENELLPLGTVRVYAVGSSGSKRTVVIAPL
jgi:spoIIIJ-associated protein